MGVPACCRWAWVVAVVAESRAIAEDAVELIDIDYEPLEPIVDPQAAIEAGPPLVHPAHDSNIVFRRKFVWGEVDETLRQCEHQISYRTRWSRNATVPIETFAVACEWNDASGILDVWASIQMPKFPDQLARALRLPGNAVRVHFDVDVGGSYA